MLTSFIWDTNLVTVSEMSDTIFSISIGGQIMRKLGWMFAILLLLTACGTKEENREQPAASEESAAQEDEKEEKSDSVNVDKKLLNVEVTIPASLVDFGEEDEDNLGELTEEAKEQGVKDITKNDDGSITYKMSKSAHKKMVKEMAEDLNETIDKTMNSDDFPSIKEINANKGFTEFSVLVDQEAFENSFDGFAVLGLALASMFYQLFDGADDDDYESTFYYIDESSGEEFDSVTYPDALNE